MEPIFDRELCCAHREASEAAVAEAGLPYEPESTGKRNQLVRFQKSRE